MDKIASDLKMSELKQFSLFKAYEALHSEASKLLLLAVQWKDLDDHFNLTRKALQEKLAELMERERNVEAREKELGERDSQLNSDIGLKSKRLSEIERAIEERRREVDSLNLSIQERRQELEIAARQSSAAKELAAGREKEVDYLKSEIKDRAKKLEVLETSLRQRSEEVESKGKELGSVQGMLKKCRDDLDSKERQIQSIRRSLEDQRKEFVLREEQIKMKEERLRAIEDSIAECNIDLEMKEKELDLIQQDFELKKRNFVSLKKSVEQCVCEFDSKEKKFDGLGTTLKVKETSAESKIEELGLTYKKKVNEFLKEVELKEKNLASLQRLVEERFHDLEKREGQFEATRKEFDSIRNTLAFRAMVKTNAPDSRVKIESSDDDRNCDDCLSFASYQYCITNGHFLQVLLSEQLKKQESLCTDIFTVLQRSPNPAKLVLDAVQGFYPLHSRKENTSLDLSIVRSGCILLLEQLTKVSLEISPQVREEAMKLAGDWKAKMTVKAENFLEVLGFVQLLASYGLASAFDADEIHSVLDVLGSSRQASELRQTLCIADKAPVDNDQAENLRSNANIAASSPNLHSSTIKIGRNLEVVQHKDSEKELEGIDKLIEEQMKVLELNMRQVDSVKSLIQENLEELEAKEGQYVAIQKLIAEKEREFDSVKRSIKEGEETLELLEKRIKQKSKEAESKEKELNSVHKTLRGYKDDIELKDRKYNAIRRSLEERKKEVELKEEQLRMCKSSIDDCEKEIKLNEEKLYSLQNSIAECSNKLESKQKQLDLVHKDIELKEKTFVSLKKSVDQWAQQFEMKEKKFEGYLNVLELKEKLCESISEELDLIYNKVNECLKECQLKQKNLGSLRKLVEKRSRELEAKESQFKKMVDEFELRRRELDSSEKATELRLKEDNDILPSQVKVEQPKNTHANNAATYQQSITIKGKDLQFLLYGHLKRHNSVCGEIFSVIQASPDPAKLVLDAMEGFYPLQSSRQNSEFDVNIIRRSCILLLEQLMESSPQINPQVREEAIKLAGDWKAMMKKENYLEALGFLQFLISYKVAFAFDADELRSLLDIVGQQGKGSELRQVLSTADVASANAKTKQAEDLLGNVVTISTNLNELSITQNGILALIQILANAAKLALDYIKGCLSQHWKRGDTAFEENTMRDHISLLDKLSRSLPKIQPVVKEDARKLAVEWKARMEGKAENHWEVLGFLQFLVTYRLVSLFGKDEILKSLETICQHKEALETCRNLGFAVKIPEFVQSLVQNKKLTDAVRLVCAFKLTDKFSPLPLLTKYMNDLKDYTKINCKGKKPIEEKDKITNEEITALTAVINCIKDCNLDCENSLTDIKRRLNLLERMKTDRRRSADLVRSRIEQQQQHQKHTWKKRPNNQGQPQGGNNKFPRTSSSSVGPRCQPVFIPVVTQPSDFPANRHAFPGDSPQFVLGGGGNFVSPNVGVFPNAGVQH